MSNKQKILDDYKNALFRYDLSTYSLEAYFGLETLSGNAYNALAELKVPHLLESVNAAEEKANYLLDCMNAAEEEVMRTRGVVFVAFFKNLVLTGAVQRQIRSVARDYCRVYGVRATLIMPILRFKLIESIRIKESVTPFTLYFGIRGKKKKRLRLQLPPDEHEDLVDYIKTCLVSGT